MKIKEMIKALKEIKMLCKDLPSCGTCPFYAKEHGGCIFLPIGDKGELPQEWVLDYVKCDK